MGLRTLPHGSYIHVRYEDICRYPAETMRTVCSFLNVPFTPEMLAFRQGTPHIIGGNPMRSRKEDKITEDKRWEQQLSAEDLATFERIAGKLNRKLLGKHY